MPNKTNDNKKKFLLALEKAKGIVMTACSITGLSRTNFYDWCKDDPQFKAQVDDIQEIAIDFVESKLMEKISGIAVHSSAGEVYDQPPSDTAIIFYLKTKGKARGYIETTVNKNVNYNTDIDPDKIKAISDKLDDAI